MSRRLTFRLMVFSIAVIGLLVAGLRHMETGIPWLPGQETAVWLVEARVDFSADGVAITASLSLPENPPGFELFEEQAASAGYGFSLLDGERGRRAVWTKRSASGDQSLYYSAQFIATEEESSAPQDGRRPRPQPVFWNDAQSTASIELLARASETSSSPISLTRELVKLLNMKPADQNTALLLSQASASAELLMQLLNQARVPARLVMALYLEDARRRQRLTPMVEVFTGDEWLLFNPQTGATGVPPNLLLWHRQGNSLLDVTGGRQSRVSFSMIQQSVPARQLALAKNSDTLFSRFGVHRLPIEEQSMFKLLLLLPLGAAVVVFMRVLVGLQTAGTFMPILVSLAFMQTSLLPGLASFVSVVAIGLVMRSYLSRLNLLLVARIATLIVLVIFMISVLSVIGYQLGYSTGMIITFFPMIIIAWTIERMSILWEEEGPREVLVQGGGSLVVAVIAYLLMENPLLQHLSFNFPELNLLLLASILAMGQYTGYKLSELRRFRAMDED
jgi:hypothetical protein